MNSNVIRAHFKAQMAVAKSFLILLSLLAVGVIGALFPAWWFLSLFLGVALAVFFGVLPNRFLSAYRLNWLRWQWPDALAWGVSLLLLTRYWGWSIYEARHALYIHQFLYQPGFWRAMVAIPTQWAIDPLHTHWFGLVWPYDGVGVPLLLARGLELGIPLTTTIPALGWGCAFLTMVGLWCWGQRVGLWGWLCGGGLVGLAFWFEGSLGHWLLNWPMWVYAHSVLGFGSTVSVLGFLAAAPLGLCLLVDWVGQHGRLSNKMPGWVVLCLLGVALVHPPSAVILLGLGFLLHSAKAQMLVVAGVTLLCAALLGFRLGALHVPVTWVGPGLKLSTLFSGQGVMSLPVVWSLCYGFLVLLLLGLLISKFLPTSSSRFNSSEPLIVLLGVLIILLGGGWAYYPGLELPEHAMGMMVWGYLLCLWFVGRWLRHQPLWVIWFIAVVWVSSGALMWKQYVIPPQTDLKWARQYDLLQVGHTRLVCAESAASPRLKPTVDAALVFASFDPFPVTSVCPGSQTVRYPSNIQQRRWQALMPLSFSRLGREGVQ